MDTVRAPLPGKFVWFELAAPDRAKAQAFYGAVLGWKTVAFPVGGFTIEMIFAGETPDTMVGDWLPPSASGRSGWVASVSVDDVDAAVARATARGARVVAPPRDVPAVGRTARITDPDGAEIGLVRIAAGDPPDVAIVPAGRFVWNELHTPDTARALEFYADVVGYEHRTLESPAGAYHVLSKDGVDRGGMTSLLPAGTPPHWLPFVKVDDVDAVVARAREHGARVPRPPCDIEGVGRTSVLEDPTGAPFALLHPLPR